ncbi:MAG: cation:proton antiporter [Thaumarchaeota archaeon]|jgi:Kef-type K+ transport system membrane component KefB|nr:cation:proton antiporter [Nitrososphaerota archaeon]NSL76949.1 cation:proton antiporter [Nitrososphaerota archaeon]
MLDFNPITTILAISLLIVTAKIFALIFKRIKLPEVIGEILAGVIFGPFAIGGLIVLAGEPLFTGPVNENFVLETFFEIGGMILLFSAGLEFTFKQFRKAGLPAFVIGTAGVIIPFLLGYYGSVYVGFSSTESLLIGAALTATSIAITIRTLEELDQLKNVESEIMIYAAVVDDVLGLTVLGVVLAIGSTGVIPGIASILSTTVFTLSLWIGLLLGSVYFLPKLLNFIASRTGDLDLTKDTERFPSSPSTLETLTIFIIFLWGAIAYYMGLSPIVGTFAAGMAIAGSQFKHKIEIFTNHIRIIFAPIFFAYVGAQINLAEIVGIDLFAFVLILTLAMVGKLLGCGIPGYIFLRNRIQAQRIGIGMSSRGEVGIVIAGIGYSSGLIDSYSYALLMGVIMVTTVISPILLRLTPDPT